MQRGIMMDNNVILRCLEKHAHENPNKLCAGDKAKSLSYSEMWNAVRSCAVWLKELGIKKGDIVVIRGMQKVEYLLAVFAVQLAGGVVSPLEKSIKDDRINEIIDFLEASFYIAEKPVKNDAVINISVKDLMDKAVCGSYPETVSANAGKAGENETDTRNDLAAGLEFPDPDSVAEIIFTTGTTGKSKGIEVTHACDIAIAQNVNDSVEMTSEGVELITTPVNHSLGLRRTYGAIYIGSSVIYTDGVKFVNSFFDLLDKYKVTAITFVPAILEQVLKSGAEKFAEYDSQLDYIQLGSAPLSEHNKDLLCRMFPSVRLYNTYGVSESGCTIILEFSKYKDKENCIGRLTVNSKVLFVDDNRNEVKASSEEPGLMAFKGPMNMKGYFKEPEITASVMDEKGIIYTNDLGYQGEDGLIYLLGRRGDVINMGGIKVAPTEVEEAASEHPMIKDCACIPVKDEITGEAIKMFVVLNEGFSFDRKELASFLLNKLESLKVPKVYEVIDQIPRTFNGKIIRKELKAREEAENI